MHGGRCLLCILAKLCIYCTRQFIDLLENEIQTFTLSGCSASRRIILAAQQNRHKSDIACYSDDDQDDESGFHCAYHIIKGLRRIDLRKI